MRNDRKKGNLRQYILFQEICFCQMAKIRHQFFFFTIASKGIRSFCFTRVAALIAADGSAGEWRCAVGGFLARALASLPCLRCVALRPPPPLVPLLLEPTPMVDVPLTRNQARHLSGTGCLDVARATANGLGFTAIRLLGLAENGRDCAEENKAVG